MTLHRWLAPVLLAVVGSAGVQGVGESRQVEVDGHAMRLVISGSGGPTVVLEAGGGWGSSQWDRVRPGLAGVARVVAYDRPGLGGSAACPKPETAHRVARELRAALRSAGLAPPYVLVAHSIGGLYARVFASLFPGEVVGLVLVDPAPERFYDRVRRELPALAAAMDQSPDAPRGDARTAVDSAITQAAASDPLPAIPVVLLTRGQWGDAPPDMARIWTEEHQLWVGRMPTARLVVASNSGHDIPREEPGLILEAVRDVLARAGRKP
jgi:pimeloyl-ACP methyl ester carboxylesterase